MTPAEHLEAQKNSLSARQGSEAWFAARLGKVTASRVCDVIAKTKTGWGASRANYMAALIAERLTGQPEETYQSAAMLRGTETEPQARAAYEFYSGNIVEPVGFCEHPTIEQAGASPDGKIDLTATLALALVEIKCPNTATHIDTLLSQTVPTKYIPQMQFQMACTGAEWCDFVSFDPRMPPSMRLFTERVMRDDKVIAELEKEIQIFLNELESRVTGLRQLYEKPEAA